MKPTHVLYSDSRRSFVICVEVCAATTKILPSKRATDILGTLSLWAIYSGLSTELLNGKISPSQIILAQS